MADSKAVSIRIPDELLAKIDDLAERKYKSIKGKPNRSLVILDALVAHFNTLSDTVSENLKITLPDTVSIEDFQELRNLVYKVVDDLEQLKGIDSTLSDSVSETGVIDVERKDNDQLELVPLINPVVTDSVNIETSVGIEINLEFLAKRLSLSQNTITNKKANVSGSEFVEWTAKKDLDGISWNPIKRGKRVYYIPAYEISSEQQETLLNWIKQNSIVE